MGEHIIKLPDVGEGVAEAELVEWHVGIGDLVREDTILAAVMTDKATVEIPSPIDGEVIWLGAEVGEAVAVGAPLVRLQASGSITGDEKQESLEEADESSPAEIAEQKEAMAAGSARASTKVTEPEAGAANASKHADVSLDRHSGAPRPEGEKPLASPAVRMRAREAGIDLRQVAGSGPADNITHEDLDAFLARGAKPPPSTDFHKNTSVDEIKIVGMRRRIADRMALANSRIAHITYVEEVDVGALETLRAALNRDRADHRPKLTLIPFLMRAMVKAIAEQPRMNALFDDEAGILRVHGGVHIGIATQTSAGLMVPVVRHSEALSLWDCATEVARLSERARAGLSDRDELSGSTITISSLGAMGGIASTPVINHPEVAIIGVNKITTRPVWDGTSFVPAKMMNLSSSFDHRVIDGWDAAVFIQRIKTLLETPALIFIGE